MVYAKGVNTINEHLKVEIKFDKLKSKNFTAAHPNASAQTTNGGTSSRGSGGMRRRSKNYASPDCGAKIVAANPESRSVRNVLVSTRDEYMLNTCKTRIWFVVQLCEAIQAKKIELGELLIRLLVVRPKIYLKHFSKTLSSRIIKLLCKKKKKS